MPKENEPDSNAHQQLRRKLINIQRELRKLLPEGYEYILSVSSKTAEAEGRAYYFTNVPEGEGAAHLERLSGLFGGGTKTPGRSLAEKRKLAGEIVEYLNELVRLDPAAVLALAESRVACNDAMAQHPTVQVHGYSLGNRHYSIGLVGILNGFVGIDDEGSGFILRIVDNEDPEAIEFCVAPE